jgi:hypothetical protein
MANEEFTLQLTSEEQNYLNNLLSMLWNAHRSLLEDVLLLRRRGGSTFSKEELFLHIAEKVEEVGQGPDLAQQVAQARALLQKALTHPASNNWGQGPYCEICGGWFHEEDAERMREHEYEEMRHERKGSTRKPREIRVGHAATCLYPRIEAFLNAEESDGQ